MLRWMAALGIAVLAGTLPLAATQPASEPASCPLRVQVTDEDGTPLPKAFVFIHNERGTNQQAAPDRTGQVKASLAPVSTIFSSPPPALFRPRKSSTCAPASPRPSI